MIESVPGVEPERRRKLMKVLDIDPAWRMHRVSDGQRRRVQICLGLLKPPQVCRGDAPIAWRCAGGSGHSAAPACSF